ncbi:MAG TPA: NAD(P)/FAD-dependent oxidoreductase [Candidatus Eisenbergiella merdavium]|uniref:NAD(P)/FAD-dependent oxidoreductase n=1 Tax=Candidatus Eisenbergiella merdavium TaxID=2838551 RepID=A0A9D2NJ60_9FIRM|nr:NAD(P)/FAD-dependent oxidoreductase [Candidatus Eisenbergiella merdavium]
MTDVIIIGAGVTGCAIARELSRYQLEVLVLEREEDVCCGTSKANSAIIHAGFDAQPGTWKARMNVEGNRMMDALSRELDFPFQRNGSLVLCFSEDQLGELEELYERGVKNGVYGLRIIRGEEIHALEPNLSPEVRAMLYAPTGGIVCPFKMTIALAENAYENGVQFSFHTTVEGISKASEGYCVRTRDKDYTCRAIVNAAGVHADVFNNMVSSHPLHITPRRGEYILMDKKAGSFVSHTIFQQPTRLGKGILITPTVHGNLLAGPTAEDISDKEATDTTAEGLAQVTEKARLSAPQIPLNMAITSFSGLRACEEKGDFVLGEAQDAPGFFNAAGIDSPGLSSAPAIGVMLAGQIVEKLHAEKKQDFHAERKDIPCVSQSTPEELEALIASDPAYGNVICRCETVTEGEILNAIRRPLGARSLDGVKRRTRAGMGRCQSGFCSPKVMELLARELDVSPLSLTKSGGASLLLSGKTKE